MNRIILFFILINQPFFCYSQKESFKIRTENLTTNSIDSFILNQKYFVYSSIIDTIFSEFKIKKDKIRTDINIDMTYAKYTMHEGYIGSFLSKEIKIEDSNCLFKLKNHFNKKTSDSLIILSLNNVLSARQASITNAFFYDVTNNFQKLPSFYLEVHSPAEGWDALTINSMCRYVDLIQKNDNYSNKYNLYKSEQIIIPVYFNSDNFIAKGTFLRFYVFNFKNEGNNIVISFSKWFSPPL